MGDSYRIKTEIGITKTINVELEQNFNNLEILSLQIQQEDLYDQSCANYGVVIGRVTANNGFGIPNAKISIFIPITDEDSARPEIVAIYPYKTPEQKNEDGFRYNLLPYEASYSGHIPTGTFPSRRDALIDKTAIEIYDKYYKYTVKTNESGDYMIMGVPLGVQIVFMDLDLSDMGEFSLTPQDLIRMGRATESQVTGRFFKSSNNLNSLPQIVSLTKSIDVSPLWGDPSNCQIAINRVDFDLRDDLSIDIQPTAVFMGSLISSTESDRLKKNCKPNKKLGELCGLTVGPGQIISLRQTIFDDENGRPILEQFNFDGGNDVIDENGVWLVDLPMNMDFLTVNEFGERILSNDPKVGIPTKAKYRFKIKWKQPEDLGQEVKRGYFLVPNVREYGWTSPTTDPKDTPTGVNYEQFVKSYAFSLDWADYGNTGTTIGRQIIQSAIDCEDKFYEFKYNQVYTIAGLIDLYQKGFNKDRYIGIKNILNETCESTNYKFPTNDVVKNRDLLFTLLQLFLTYTFFGFYALIPVIHILAILWPIFKVLYITVYTVIFGLIYGLCRIVSFLTFRAVKCKKPTSIKELWNKLENPFVNLPLPMLTYPDCDFCSCQQEEVPGETGALNSALEANAQNSNTCFLDTRTGTAFSSYNTEEYCKSDPILNLEPDRTVYSGSCQYIQENTLSQYIPKLLSGIDDQSFSEKTPAILYPPEQVTDGFPRHSQDLTLSERINLFNLKGKYFDSLSSQGGGQNQIKVKINPTVNTGPNDIHYDNVIALVIDSSCAESFTAGRIISFNDPNQSKDLNLSSGQTITYTSPTGDIVSIRSITGESRNTTNITVGYANPNNPTQLLQTNYVVPKTIDIDFSTRNSNTVLGQTLQDEVFYDFFLNQQIVVGSMTIICNSVTLTDFGNGILSGVGTSNFGTIDYDSGSITIQFENNQTVGSNITATYTHYTPISQGDTDYIIQKYPTDVEYFQVITATTFSDFISKNPPINPSPGTRYFYNNNTTRPDYNSLRYRYLDNFQTIFRQSDRETLFLSNGCNPFLYYNKIKTFETYRPIYALDGVSEQLVVFLVRGVDPHSARIETEYDVSRLFGQSYGTFTVKGNYKLNIPIQPNLVLPRHNQITNTTSQSQGSYLFYPSYGYKPTNSFSAYSSNLISNYSSLDSSQINQFLIDSSNSTTVLNSNKINVVNGYVAAGSFNGFSRPNYIYNRLQSPPIIQNTCATPVDWNSGAYCGTQISLDLRTIGPGKQHRGYYTNEYVEGGSYFSLEYNINFPIQSCFNVITNAPFQKDDFKYFSPIYSTAVTVNFQQSTERIVMRSDRLPSSSNRTNNLNNSYFLQQNNNVSIFSYEDNGESSESYYLPAESYSSGDAEEDDLSPFEAQIQNSFNCEGLVPLGCYQGSGENLEIKPKTDSCYDKITIINGCFTLVTTPLLINIFKDFRTLSEYKGRLKINFGACRGLFGHSFYNNWVNGVLFAFPFKNNRRFTVTNIGNIPFNRYCEDTLMLHPTSNNFYYRSSPYNFNVQRFIGKQGKRNGRNSLQLLFPTTITNMGPRDEFSYELTLSSDYFGYNMDKIPQTTYQDVENLLNLFIISRLTASGSRKFFQGNEQAIGKYSINQFFNSRNKRRADGDYAQSISINSELGINGFDFESYDFQSGNTGGNTFYLKEKTMGVFFSSDTQTRDYVTPRRIIRDDFTNPGVYDDLGFNSQEVPFYSWIVRTDNAASIFGTEKNEWGTSSSDILKFKYQSLDRLNLTSDFYIGEIQNIPFYSKGYIYNVTLNPTTGAIEFEGDLRGGQILGNTGRIHVGAPFHFYFGLVRGANAMDLFNKKFLGYEIL